MFSSHASPLASSSVNSPDEILDAICNINLAAPPPSTTVPTSLTGEFSLPLGGDVRNTNINDDVRLVSSSEPYRMNMGDKCDTNTSLTPTYANIVTGKKTNDSEPNFIKETMTSEENT